MTKTMRRLFLTAAITAGFVTAATGPASALGGNHCEPLLTRN